MIGMHHRSLLLVFLLCVALPGCGSAASGGEDGQAKAIAQSRAEFDDDAARVKAVSELSGQTFQDVGDTSRCTKDCSGHDAGWQWAQDNEVTDSSDCSGSGSFEDGCEAYVEELDSRVEAAREDDESEPDDEE